MVLQTPYISSKAWQMPRYITAAYVYVGMVICIVICSCLCSHSLFVNFVSQQCTSNHPCICLISARNLFKILVYALFLAVVCV